MKAVMEMPFTGSRLAEDMREIDLGILKMGDGDAAGRAGEGLAERLFPSGTMFDDCPLGLETLGGTMGRNSERALGCSGLGLNLGLLGVVSEALEGSVSAAGKVKDGTEGFQALACSLRVSGNDGMTHVGWVSIDLNGLDEVANNFEDSPVNMD